MTKYTAYYWTRINGKFGKDIGFGDPMPADIDKETLAVMIKRGFVSEEQPANFDEAKESQLTAVKKENEELKLELTAVKEELSGVPKNITAARKEIKDLKQQIEDLTNPED